MLRGKKIKLGLAPTRRVYFSAEEAVKSKNLIRKKLKSMKVDFVDLEWLNSEGLYFNPSDAPVIAEKFRKEGVDAIFTPHCNFGSEECIAKLGRAVGKPLLLWGPRDDKPLPNGVRLTDSQCGLFATSKVLRRMHVPFSYITNCELDGPVFERGFRNFIGAAAAANAFKNARIGQVATRPAPFWTMIVNEGELLERWGVEIVPITLVEIAKRVKDKIKADPKLINNAVKDMKSRVKFSADDEEGIKNMAGLIEVLKDWFDEAGLNAVAFQCWTALQDALGIFPCFVFSELTGAGFLTICETDINGALTALMVQNAVQHTTPIFFGDLAVRHPTNNNAELLWHCGPFPSVLADTKEKKVESHFLLPEPGPLGCASWRIKGGDITIARFDGDNGEYSLLMGHAKGVKGPHNVGTYVWVEVENWPEWEHRVIYGPYVHHVVGVHEHIAPMLYDACRYIPGLKPDPVHPKEDEILAYLRGDDIN